MRTRRNPERWSAAGQAREGGCAGAWLLLAALIGLSGGGPGAETITWSNPAGGAWLTAGNWDPQDVPNEAGEVAYLAAGGGNYAVDLNGAIALDAIINENAGATIWIHNQNVTTTDPAGFLNAGSVICDVSGGILRGRLENLAGATFEVRAGVSRDVRGPVIHNDGAIRINPTGTATTTLFYVGEDVTLEGTGELRLHTSGNPDNAWLYTNGGGLTQAAGHAIRGDGHIRLPWVNDGLIAADVSGRQLLIDGNYAKANHGTLSAANGGVLQLAWYPITQSASGLILADGGTVELRDNVEIVGGNFNTANAGVIRVANNRASLRAIHNLGQLDIPANRETYAYGPTITNDGTITVNSDQSGGAAYLYLADGEVTLDGTGQTVLLTHGDPYAARLVGYNGGSLVQAAGHTIRGEGMIAVGLRNEGLVSADVASRVLVLNSAPKTNNATLRATNNGILALTTGGAVTQGPAGVILADGGVVELRADADVLGGTLNTVSGGVIRAASSVCYLREIHNLGQLDIPSYQAIRIYGPTLTNDGTITINSNQGAGEADLYIADGEVALSGPGQIVVRTNGDPYRGRLASASGGSLVQAAGHTIRGEGMVAVGLRNEGLVDADVASRALVLNSLPKTNNATFRATHGGILALTTGGAVTQGDQGLILADGGTVELRQDADIRGGDLNTVNGGVMRVTTGQTHLRAVRNLGHLDIPGNRAVYCYGPTITNDGTITVNSDQGGASAYLHFADAEVTLAGVGQTVLQTNGDPYAARLASYNGGSLAQADGHTIRGDGMIYAAMRNEGLIAGDVAGRTLVLNGDPKTNRGTVRAANGGTVNITSSFSNLGTAEATAGGTFRLENPSGNYSGGTLTGGAWQVYANSTMRLIGANVTTLAAGVLLDGANANLYRDDGTTSALAGLTTIADGGGLEIRNGRNLTTAGTITTSMGTIRIGAGSTLSVNGDFRQYGYEQPEYGQTWVNGTLDPTGAATIHGGILGGAGTILTDLTNGGRLNPGASVGTMTIAGSYAQADSGALYIELSAQGNDRLIVAGHASLAGRIWIRSADGYEPAPGDTFQVLSCASRSGAFSLLWGCPGVGLQYTVHYHPNRVTIEIYADPSVVPEPDLGDTSPDPVDGTEIPAGATPHALRLQSRVAPGDGAMLSLELPDLADVDVAIYDLTGRRVARLGTGVTSAGIHEYRWDGRASDGRPAGSGVYLARVRVRGAGAAGARVARVLLVR